MASLGDVSKIILPGDKEYNFKDAAMRSEIATARGTYASLGARLDDMSGGGVAT